MNETQLAWLKDNCNSIPFSELCTIINQYNVDITKLPLSQDRVETIERRAESEAWSRIVSCDDTNAKMNLCREYINRYGHAEYAAEHIAEAKRIIRTAAEQAEANDWGKVNIFDYKSLCEYKDRHPQSIHMNDIECAAWNVINRTSREDIERFLNDFPKSAFDNEARAILKASTEWSEVSRTGNIIALEEYVKNNPNSPYTRDAIAQIWARVRASGDIFRVDDFIHNHPYLEIKDEAISYLSQLKQRELEQMKANPSSYNIDKILKLLDKGLIAEQELIDNRVASKASLSLIRNRPNLPPLAMGNSSDAGSAPQNCTDVFLLGIPSSGKTCALMGLLGASGITYNHIIAGGSYAETLENYRHAGQTPGATVGNFMTLINANVLDGKITHHVNIVEMAGEQLAIGIAQNSNAAMGFEQLAQGATNLMMNDNRKVLFIVIDPSSNGLIEYNSAIYNVKAFIDQRQIIARLINIMSASKNVMKKVDSIHFIMTKADMLGSRNERDTEAYNRFNNLYHNEVESLSQLMKDYGINANTKYRPRLYTFSLGNFYVGDVYDYDPEDADKLVDVIKNVTRGRKQRTAWDIVKEKFNN